MSNQITANGFSPSTLADLPAIRTFQMDSDSHSQIANSVNLFRGDINLPLELIVNLTPAFPSIPAKAEGYSGWQLAVQLILFLTAG